MGISEPTVRRYLDTLTQTLMVRQLQPWYENLGKRSGAYSAPVYGVHPYMLMNWSETLDDVFTMAHEVDAGAAADDVDATVDPRARRLPAWQTPHLVNHRLQWQ